MKYGEVGRNLIVDNGNNSNKENNANNKGLICKKHTDNFYYIDGLSPPNLLMFAKRQQLNGIEQNLNTLVEYTANTWQQNRQSAEVSKNTLQGKIVESFFVDFINLYNHNNHKQNNKRQDKHQYQQLVYLSYDDIRTDAYKKHAPFDGLLFQKDNPYIDQVIAQITADIQQGGKWGKISQQTRQLCRQHRIYSIEIKSSKIPKRALPKAVSNPQKVAYQRQLIDNLRRLDVFKYPNFNRNSASKIYHAKGYFDWVRNNIHAMQDKSDKEIIYQEIANSSDIYTRIFIDDKQQDAEGNALFLAYMLGYVFVDEFYDDLHIMSFPSVKSKHALYATYPIANSHNFDSLFYTEKLWG